MFGGGFNSPRGWVFTRNAGNPLIAKQYNTSPNQYEYYPPCHYYDGSNFYCMAKNNNEGWGYSSAGGVAWSETAKLLPLGSGGSWDAGLASPNCMIQESGVLDLWYAGYVSSPNYNYKIGLASITIVGSLNATWGTAFTKSVSNPVYDVTEWNTANPTNTADGIQLDDIVLHGGTYYFFGHTVNNSFTGSTWCYGTGTTRYDIHLTIPIVKVSDLPGGHTWMQCSSVFKNAAGKWRATLTFGDQSTTENIIAAYTDASTPTGWNVKTNTILGIVPGSSFENKQVYCGKWTKALDGALWDFSGRKRLYYSAHDSTGTYTGAMCLADTNYIP